MVFHTDCNLALRFVNRLTSFLIFKELQTFVETQKQDKANKREPGLNEEQVETLKQVSSLVAMFQQEALNEKQTRLLAQLKAIEKVRFESFIEILHISSLYCL